MRYLTPLGAARSRIVRELSPRAACARVTASAALIAPTKVAAPKTVVNYQASQALPFMEKPAALDGSMAGDVGFDPFGFSEVFDIKWLREAELKHGRICMLAWTGFVATDLGFVLPGEMHQVSSIGAHDSHHGRVRLVECRAARKAGERVAGLRGVMWRLRKPNECSRGR